MANEQTQESECAFSNDKLKEQGHPHEKTANKENASGNDQQCTSSDIVVDIIAAESNSKDSIAIWFKTSFGLIGAHGSIRKELFISAVKQIGDDDVTKKIEKYASPRLIYPLGPSKCTPCMMFVAEGMGVTKLKTGFADNLFNIFDSNERDLLSVQELVGGIGLLIQQDKNQRNSRQLLHWFNNRFKSISDEGSHISRDKFVEHLKDDEFVSRLFTVFDLDGNGEIQIKEFISSLDRLECASVDSKWYTWIEHHFNIDESDDRKITFEQFKDALHLKKSFFSERFFSMFDTDGDGSINMKELVNGLQILTKGTESEKLKFLFKVYDIDGNGSLNKEEMRIVLQSCVQESNIKFTEDQMEELVDAFFEETDEDHNGQITFEEFSSCLSKFPGVAENLTITAGNWLSPPEEKSRRRLRDRTRSKMRWATLKKNGLTVFFVVLYFLVNAGLFIWVAIQRKDEGGWVIVARVHGMCLNFNSMFILVLMMKHSLTWLRSTRIGKYFPIDHHIAFHKAVAVVIFIQGVLHFIGHLGRYIVTESGIQVWEYLFTTKAGEGWVSGTAGITGVLLFIIFGIMALMSLPFVRSKGHFELFYFTHHLYVVWWTLLILHAPNFWKWFIGPAVIYIIERISSLRIVNKARYGKTFIKEGIIFPSNVTQLIIPRSQKFKYKSGDYVLVNIPHIAKYEWHPFTISSSPDQTETIWLHIRAVGTWTKNLYNYYNEELKKNAKRTRMSKRKTISHIMREERKTERHLRQRKLYSSLKEEPTWKKKNNNEDKTQQKFFAIPEENGINSKTSITLKSIKTISSSSLSEIPDTGIGKLEIYVDGPYGAPAEHFFEAEHAVLVSSGIGVTPFASILQTIMLRYKSASHSCPNCEHSWVGNVPFSLRKLQKVDFFWINRDQASFEWFISLLAQLEMEQSEQRGVFSEHFLDMHIYMTSALKKEDIKALGLQMALELIHEKKEKDLITGLKTKTNPGRPDWDKVFMELNEQNHGEVSVFYCGNPALGTTLRRQCEKYKFEFRSEKF